MRRASFIAAVVLAAFAFGISSPAATRIAPSEFEARIETARAIAVAGVSRPSPERMNEVERTLGLPVDVEFSWGIVALGQDPVFRALPGRASADFRQAVAHLDALTEHLRAAEAAHPRDRTEVRDAMGRSFDGIQTQKSWVQIARERFLQLLGALVERILRATAGGFGLAAVLIIMAALIALAAWLIARRLRLVPERSMREHQAGVGRPDWRLIAVEAEQRGDLDAAVRAHYQILLNELARRGIVEDEPSLTAGECRVAVAGSRPNIYPVVADGTDAFEHVAYGHTEPRIEHVDRLRRAAEAAKAA